MVTWTFDLVALIVGFIVGFMVGALIVACWISNDERFASEWNEGYRRGTEVTQMIYMKGREDEKNDSDAE